MQNRESCKDRGDEEQLAGFDPHIEAQKRKWDGGLRQADLRKGPRESETVE